MEGELGERSFHQQPILTKWYSMMLWVKKSKFERWDWDPYFKFFFFATLCFAIWQSPLPIAPTKPMDPPYPTTTYTVRIVLKDWPVLAHSRSSYWANKISYFGRYNYKVVRSHSYNWCMRKLQMCKIFKEEFYNKLRLFRLIVFLFQLF